MVAGNTGQGKTWSIVQHVPLWPLTNPCIWSGSWLVGSLVGWCELHQNHPLVCNWDTEVSIQDVSSWVLLWNSGQYELQGQVHYASILASNTKTNTQQGNTGVGQLWHSILISRAQNNFVPPSCFSHVTSLQSMTLSNWTRNLLFLLIFIFIDRSAFVWSLWEEILLTRRILDANYFQISSLKRVPPHYSDNYYGLIHLASCGKQENIRR